VSSKPIIICDANILIDYIDSDGTILCRAAAHCYDIFTTESIVREVMVKRPALNIAAYGVKICDAEFAQMAEAQEFSASSPLSFEDSLCFILARDNSWICATNEKALRNKCQKEKISTIRGLRFMLDLVSLGKLSKGDAIRIAKEIETANSRIPQNVIAEFIRLLKDTI